MLVPVECLVVECDVCGASMDDLADDFDADTIIHFASKLEVVAYLGGIHEGRFYAGTGRSGGVLMTDGTFYCYACKVSPHLNVPGEMIESVCARCGELADTHPEAVFDGPYPAGSPRTPAPTRRGGLTPRQGTCVHDCRHDHRYPAVDIPEPPDGSRIEFTYATDRYAAWRDTESTVLAGWPADMSWCVYPASVGHTWWCMQRTFGPALEGAILLAPAGVLRATVNGQPDASP